MRRIVRILAAAMLLSPLAVRAQSSADLSSEHYLGELYLFRLDEVAVIYPAGPGEDAAANRRSAEARAAFLEQAHRVKTRVLPDDPLGPEDRHRHLLLLGWNNRLLGTTEAPSIFTHSSEGLAFLEIRTLNQGVDLLFFTSSPYDRDKALVFWSRMDPERDRVMMLPAVGSDWALYSDFRVIRQGMFERPHEWPPKRANAAEKDHAADLARIDALDSTRYSDHYTVDYPAARIDTAESDAILKARETAFARAAAKIGAPPEGFKISLRVYEDETSKEKRTGLADPAHSIPAARELHMTRRAAHSSSPHEEIHILAREAFGPCRLTTLYEGLAVAEDGAYRGLDLDLHAAALIEKGAFPAIADFLDEEKARPMTDAVRYPAAGLLVTWIRETAGVGGLKKAYTATGAGLAALASSLGKPADAVELGFRQWVEARIRARQADVAFMKCQTEAQERLKDGDYAGVAAAIKRALLIRPDDPQSLFNLASAEMRIRKYDAAETHLKRIVGLPLGPKDSRFAIFGRYQLGRLFDIQSRREDALAEYRLVLELPDQFDAHRLAKEAMETPATAESLQ